MRSSFALLVAALAPAASAQVCTGPLWDAPFERVSLVDEGVDHALLAAGNPAPQVPTRVARRTAADWDVLPGAFTGPGDTTSDNVLALAETSFGLVAVGRFSHVDDVFARRVARFDGQAWQALGGGLNGGSQTARAVVEHAGELWVGGSFTLASATPAANVARWDGTAWSAAGLGTNGAVVALAVHDGLVVAGGSFTMADGQPIAHVAAWDGAAWNALGSPLPPVTDLAGLGGRLFAIAGGKPYVLDGAAWQQIGAFPLDVTAQRAATTGGRLMVLGSTTSCQTTGGNPCRARVVFEGGAWTVLAPDASATVGGATLAGAAGAFFETRGGDVLEHSPGFKVQSIDGAAAPWHAGTTVELSIDCLASALPVQLVFAGLAPITGVATAPGVVEFAVPANSFDTTGPQDAVVVQGGERRALAGVFQVWPSLTVSTTDFLLQSVGIDVHASPEPGTVMIFTAPSLGAPLALDGVFGPALLDVTGFQLLTVVPLDPLGFVPDFHASFATGTVPGGTTLAVQALVLQDVGGAPTAAFTNAATLVFTADGSGPF